MNAARLPRLLVALLRQPEIGRRCHAFEVTVREEERETWASEIIAGILLLLPNVVRLTLTQDGDFCPSFDASVLQDLRRLRYLKLELPVSPDDVTLFDEVVRLPFLSGLHTVHIKFDDDARLFDWLPRVVTATSLRSLSIGHTTIPDQSECTWAALAPTLRSLYLDSIETNHDALRKALAPLHDSLACLSVFLREWLERDIIGVLVAFRRLRAFQSHVAPSWIRIWDKIPRDLQVLGVGTYENANETTGGNGTLRFRRPH